MVAEATRQGLGIDVEWLDGRSVRRREPHLRPGVVGAVCWASPEFPDAACVSFAGTSELAGAWASASAGSSARPNRAVDSLFTQASGSSGRDARATSVPIRHGGSIATKSRDSRCGCRALHPTPGWRVCHSTGRPLAKHTG